MKTVTLLIRARNGIEYVVEAYENWADAQKRTELYNEILLKEGHSGLYFTKTLKIK